ncbi:hypothetical protein [Arsukibacterium sp.]|uniref:hypothetical protein n=1 Tax=Arsukibacterium sp. TaxID=1977258 RepID=UPI00299DD9CB|nr:hypothetical protein [Arsukibacterium sp.]MDX1677814.1 hypothetical protein [Arsukibacterium sp.]
MDRIEAVHTLTKRLIVMTLVAVLVVGAISAITLFGEGRLMITWLCFLCGIIGGFVSIQQRIRKVSDEELELLNRSWFPILLVPIFGGVFSLVLYVIFLSGIMTGGAFPEFDFPVKPEGLSDTFYMKAVLSQTYPSTGQDLAKLVFWSFVSGFSERFVPQIVTKISNTSRSKDA